MINEDFSPKFMRLMATATEADVDRMMEYVPDSFLKKTVGDWMKRIIPAAKAYVRIYPT